jgi:GTPase SAR1 family protein
MLPVKNALAELSEINDRYGLDRDGSIKKHISQMDFQKVCAPLTGHFSSGKSAIVNALLGRNEKVLKENITPETAIPAEVIFAGGEAESVAIDFTDNHTETISLSDYAGRRLRAQDVKSICISLQNDFLAAVKSVKLVDMPGFESANTVHDKAIDDYVPQSMAYIVAFPADRLTLTTEIGHILKELCSFDKPVYFMITKADKKPPREDYLAGLKYLESSLGKYVGNRPIDFFETSAKNNDTDGLKKCLLDIERLSAQLIRKKFAAVYAENSAQTLAYLKKRLESMDLSETELKGEEEKLNRQMQQLAERTKAHAEKFNKDTANCANDVANDVRSALEGIRGELVAMAISKNDGGVREKIKSTVQVAVNESLKRRFYPKAEKYLNTVYTQISIDPAFSGIAAYDPETSSGGGNILSGVLSPTVLVGLSWIPGKL